MSVKRAKNRASSFLQQLDPCVTFALAQLVEAHSFLSFSPCIELCLSGRPGGRRTQRSLHLSLRPKTKNLSVPTMTLACVSSTPYIFYFSTTPHPFLLTPLLCSLLPYFLCVHFLKFKWLTSSSCIKSRYLLFKFLAFLSLLSPFFILCLREKFR